MNKSKVQCTTHCVVLGWPKSTKVGKGFDHGQNKFCVSKMFTVCLVCGSLKDRRTCDYCQMCQKTVLSFNVDKGVHVEPDPKGVITVRTEYAKNGNVYRFPMMFRKKNRSQDAKRPFVSILGTFKTFSAMCSAGAKYGNLKRKARMLERIATQPGQLRITHFRK